MNDYQQSNDLRSGMFIHTAEDGKITFSATLDKENGVYLNGVFTKDELKSAVDNFLSGQSDNKGLRFGTVFLKQLGGQTQPRQSFQKKQGYAPKGNFQKKASTSPAPKSVQTDW